NNVAFVAKGVTSETSFGLSRAYVAPNVPHFGRSVSRPGHLRRFTDMLRKPVLTGVQRVVLIPAVKRASAVTRRHGDMGDGTTTRYDDTIRLPCEPRAVR